MCCLYRKCSFSNMLLMSKSCYIAPIAIDHAISWKFKMNRNLMITVYAHNGKGVIKLLTVEFMKFNM